MIHLRPHHFLCILTFIGKGYSQNFVRNYQAVIDRINKGERQIIIVEGPDDICRPRLLETNQNHHCLEDRITGRDKTALLDLQTFFPGHNFVASNIVRLSEDLISNLRIRFHRGDIRKACKGCEWFELCNQIRDDNFQKAKLSSLK